MDSVLTVFGVLLSIAVVGPIAITLIWLGQVLIKRLVAKGRPRLEEGDLEFLREQAHAIDELRDRVAELENRVDFAERLLAAPSRGSGAPERGAVG